MPKIVCGRITRADGSEIKIPIFTVADVTHLVALSMGYKEDVAFALGVLSRSAVQQHGTPDDYDCDIETASNTVALAAVMNTIRITGGECGGENLDENRALAIVEATKHIHTLEQCYVELTANNPALLTEFAEMYAEYLALTENLGKPQEDPQEERKSKLAYILSKIPKRFFK